MLVQNTLQNSHKRIQLELQQQFREIEQLISTPFAEYLPELRMRLNAVMRLATEYFRAEERGGFMNAVKEQGQRFESDLESMRDEHREMKRDLDYLVDEAEAVRQFDRDFSERVLTWIANFRHHEKREIELLQEAFDVDVGGEG